MQTKSLSSHLLYDSLNIKKVSAVLSKSSIQMLGCHFTSRKTVCRKAFCNLVSTYCILPNLIELWPLMFIYANANIKCTL